MRALLLSALAVTTLAACSGAATQTEPTPAIRNTSWMMEIPKGADCDAAPYIEFTDKKASGDMGCNSFNAEYTLKGSSLRFKNVAATLRLCAPDSMALEETMQRVLNETHRIKLTDNRLTFFDGAGKPIATLVPEAMGACR